MRRYINEETNSFNSPVLPATPRADSPVRFSQGLATHADSPYLVYREEYQASIADASISLFNLYKSTRDLLLKEEKQAFNHTKNAFRMQTRAIEIHQRPFNEMPTEVLGNVFRHCDTESAKHFLPTKHAGRIATTSTLGGMWFALEQEVLDLSTAIRAIEETNVDNPRGSYDFAHSLTFGPALKAILARQSQKVQQWYESHPETSAPTENRVTCPTCPDCPDNCYCAICLQAITSPFHDCSESCICLGTTSALVGSIIGIVALTQGCSTGLMASSLTLFFGGLLTCCGGIAGNTTKCGVSCDRVCYELGKHNQDWAEFLSLTAAACGQCISYPCRKPSQYFRVKKRERARAQLASKVQRIMQIPLSQLLAQQMREDMSNSASITTTQIDNVVSHVEIIERFLATNDPAGLQHIKNSVTTRLQAPMPDIMR